MALETVVPRDGSRDDLKVLPTEAEGLRPGGFRWSVFLEEDWMAGVMAPINGLQNQVSWG